MLLGRNGSVDAAWKETYYPWLKYQADAPSRASSLQCRYQDHACAWGSWVVSYRWSRVARNQVQGNLRRLQPEDRHAVRLRWAWQPLDAWTLQCQWDTKLVNADHEWERGSQFSQRLGWKGERWQWTASLGFFDTDSYQTALYLAEKEVLSATTTAVCSGKGLRAYLLLACRCTSSSSLYLRLSAFQYRDREVTGSGASRIEAPHRSEVKIQWVWKG